MHSSYRMIVGAIVHACIVPIACLRNQKFGTIVPPISPDILVCLTRKRIDFKEHCWKEKLFGFGSFDACSHLDHDDNNEACVNEFFDDSR